MKKKLKAVLFDMDGVLFDSMPYHSEAWHKVMKSHGLTLSREEAYMHEGRTGASTINIVFQRELGREATQEEIESIGDSCYNLARTINRKRQTNQEFTEKQYEHIHFMMKLTDDALGQMIVVVERSDHHIP